MMEHLSALAAAASAQGRPGCAVFAAARDFFRSLSGGRGATSSQISSSQAASSGAAQHAHTVFPQLSGLSVGIAAASLAVILAGVIVLIVFLKRRRAGRLPGSGISKTAQLKNSSQSGLVTAVLVGNAQHIGKRENQQDAFAISDVSNEALCNAKGIFAVVADGMGGLANGSEVSNIVVRSMLEFFEQCKGDLPRAQLMQRMLNFSNDNVNASLARQGNVQSGSTVVAVVVHKGELHWVSVGDSRLYLFRKNRLWQINKPHNLGAELDEKALFGQISREEALAAPERHALTSYLGIGRLELVDANTVPFALEAGDKIILCSDGIFGAVSDEEMASLLTYPPHQAAEEIQKLVMLKGRKYQDNSTIIILECV